MKQWMIIVFMIILLMAATARYFLKISDKIDDEMQFYVHHLNYDFTAKIDSVVLPNKYGLGQLLCHITRGRYNESVEDSLNRHLVNYKRIRFLFFGSKGQFVMFTRSASKYQIMDSISVNSAEDWVRIFRRRQSILDSKISDVTFYKVNFSFWLKD